MPSFEAASDRLWALSALELRAGFHAGAFSPRELIDSLAARVERIDPVVNALTTTALQEARLRATDASRRYANGSARALEGVPVVVKDLIDTAALRTTYGSRVYENHVPRRDAAVVARLRRAGAIILAKAATHEFAWGITTESPHSGPTRNPWSLDRVPGGSSGGSAAALASRLSPLAIGTDTGGSIRIPAAFCGVVGLKPTRGRLPLDGVFGLAFSLDHVGPMARTPPDLALLMNVLACAPSRPDAHLEPSSVAPLQGLRVGRCRDLEPVSLAPAAATAVEGTLNTAASLGAEVIEVELPEADNAYGMLATIVLAEGLWHHRRLGLWPQRAGSYSLDVQERLRLAEQVAFDDYFSAVRKRVRLEGAAIRLLSHVDVLVAPVCAEGPPPIVEAETAGPIADLRVDLREALIACNALASLAGLPACCIRAGFDERGLPVGIQIIGAPSSDDEILRVAETLWRATCGVQDRWPADPAPSRPA